MAKADIEPEELLRLKQLTLLEDKARKRGFQAIAGIDEAGRGPLAGPVVAAACIIPRGVWIKGVNDSKKLTPLRRQYLYEQMVADGRIHFGIGIVDSIEIDCVNILQATIKAMHKAVSQLARVPDYLLIDGLQIVYEDIPAEKVIGGDAKSQSIAAASVLAKETRDRLMVALHEEWPLYGFHKHKGYGTAEHLEAIKRHGPCPIHRRSFEPIKSYPCGATGT